MIDHAREDRIPVDFGQPIVLEVHNPNGDVTVRASERSDVLIGHVIHGLPLDAVDAVLTIDAQQNRIVVRANPQLVDGWGGFGADIDLDAVVGQITRAFKWGGPRSTSKLGKVRVPSSGQAWCDIVIEVPRAISGRVEVQTASGDVRVEEVTSELALQTASGDVRVVRTEGHLTLRTASGDVTVEGSAGGLNAHTASGDLRVTSSRVDGFYVQTASGDVLLDALLRGDGPCRAQTASGDVRLALRQATSGAEATATLTFQTVSGDAHVTPPFRKIGRRLWQAGNGSGGPQIEVTTVSGDLNAGIAAVERGVVATAPQPPVSDNLAPPAPPAPPVPPVPPTPPAAPAPVMAAAPSSPLSEPSLHDARWPSSKSDFVASNGEAAPAQTTPLGVAERLAVLEAVERGEIDVEEALRRLEASDAVTSP